MDFSSCIGQKGVIEEISDNKISVTITKAAACEGCHAHSSCTAIVDPTRKIVIQNTGFNGIPGEEVMVFMHKSTGWKAIVLAYLVPFILLISLLGMLSRAGLAEPATGALILAALSGYFLGLYFLRKRLQKTFTFTLQKTS
jgi:sigma-E factor negative regulatory protein RseC